MKPRKLLELVARYNDGETLAALAAEVGCTPGNLRIIASRAGYIIDNHCIERLPAPAEAQLWPRFRRQPPAFPDSKAAVRALELARRREAR